VERTAWLLCCLNTCDTVCLLYSQHLLLCLVLLLCLAAAAAHRLSK
jgi:hypothetical protein